MKRPLTLAERLDGYTPLLPPPAIPPRTRELQLEELRYRIAVKVREMTDPADLYAVLMTIQRREREATDG